MNATQNKLQPCPDCGQLVSYWAKACPHCGRPNPTTTPLDKTIGYLLGTVILVVVSLFVFANVKSCVPSIESAKRPLPISAD